MSGSDAQSRRNILQGLQQTRSRLQKQHSEEPQRASIHSRGGATGGHAHQVQKSSPTYSSHQQLAPPSRAVHLSPSPIPENSVLIQQQKLAMQQVTAQSSGYFIPQPSTHSNLVLPVLPRFDNSGQLM